MTAKTAERLSEKTNRQRWLAVLARASRDEVAAIAGTELPRHDILKAPETGTVMVEGRAGGAGRRFNLGEATVTRCIVRLDDGAMGFAYALGRDARKARLAAILDAQLQAEAPGSVLHRAIEDLADRQRAARDLASRKAAATKVDFFTLVRGA
ncbi:MAG TPA: phosphonate C-P lyase system protein PhnG [Bosea sp. (in: a-proteobacteria)]|uniref:phosphonate C-P lyase system protein PhnG n=1 Tax=Bosea sp. (in: a-proteobacteria) TaxID=1871050 RepID=UPI002E15503E|nr:phosphonate C-P lyase system protein PhnG [Bosea sp. (in: a-proteobacteria)]